MATKTLELAASDDSSGHQRIIILMFDLGGNSTRLIRLLAKVRRLSLDGKSGKRQRHRSIEIDASPTLSKNYLVFPLYHKVSMDILVGSTRLTLHRNHAMQRKSASQIELTKPKHPYPYDCNVVVIQQTTPLPLTTFHSLTTFEETNNSLFPFLYILLQFSQFFTDHRPRSNNRTCIDEPEQLLPSSFLVPFIMYIPLHHSLNKQYLD